MRTASLRCQATSSRIMQVQKRHSIRDTYPEPETEKERSSVDFPQVLPCAAQERSAFHHRMTYDRRIISSHIAPILKTNFCAGVDDAAAKQAARCAAGI